MSRVREVIDLRRAVIELAVVRGWHAPLPGSSSTTAPLQGLAYSSRMVIGSDVGWPDLTLVRRMDRRLVFAALTADGPRSLSPRRRLVIDLLASLRWNASADERRRAEEALGHPVPSIEAVVWRPADLVTGTIDKVLR
jgi:hypothetical protein